MIRYHARWVVPVTRPPVPNGTVVEDAGRIVYVGGRDDAPGGDDVELGDVEAEDLHATPEPRQTAVGNPLAAVRPQRRVDHFEIGHELVHVAVAAVLAFGGAQQAVVHEPQLAPVRLIVGRRRAFGGGVFRQPLLVGGNGGEQGFVHVHQRT